MMDDRRDLVDREALRRRLEENFSESNTHAWVGAHRSVLSHLDAMPAVEWTRGWTRGEVLAELDADPDAVCEVQNPLIGEWGRVSRHSVSRWHPKVRRYDVRVVRVGGPGPEWVPLTQLVGRTIDKCDKPVDRTPFYSNDLRKWGWHDGDTWQDFPEGTLNLDNATVAVRPKAAT